MSTLMAASNQWATRPPDERFTDLYAMTDALAMMRYNSAERVVSSQSMAFRPAENGDHHALEIVGHNGGAANLTNWAFGQMATAAKAPARYLRTLPAALAADNLNFGLKFGDISELGVLLTRGEDDTPTMRAATGPNYGRVWNAAVARMLADRFGDGVSGEWRVPGEFGKAVTVDKNNTTLYAGDRDMFVFLCDEERRIEIPNRRNGESGGLARGFFVWNSEVGSASLGAAFFLFDFVCKNRMVWGARDYKEIRLRHTSGAPDRWLRDVTPVLSQFANASPAPIQQAIADAREQRIDTDLTAFLANRFGSKSMAERIMQTHEEEEGRPIETRWDVVTGATAYARTIPNQDARVTVERKAGELLG